MNVRFQIRDRDSEEYLISEDEMTRMILRKSQEMTGMVIPGEGWVSNALTLSAGTFDTTYAGATLDSVQVIRETTKGLLMERWTRQAMEWARQGPTLAVGYPRAYYLVESDLSVMTVRFYPKADKQYLFDVLLSGLPDGTVSDSTVVPYSDLVVAAIEKAVACECLAKIPPDILTQRKLSWQSLLPDDGRRDGADARCEIVAAIEIQLLQAIIHPFAGVNTVIVV